MEQQKMLPKEGKGHPADGLSSKLAATDSAVNRIISNGKFYGEKLAAVYTSFMSTMDWGGHASRKV
ncbi:hypothetical protein [Paenibacillus apii]|uniref:hypothetical protein n=1 Tax=Paenibacillus apii TaxID=1850370 RepID=UPI00143A8D09|nr:hypothetical protein [Paenibacillus apii]NJJ39859.1 hypothetical protein [Paenibacillus apii]